MQVTGQYFVFTSRHGVAGFEKNRHAMKIQDNEIKIFCLIGETLNAAQKINHADIIATAANAAELATKIVSMKTVDSVSFFCGNRRRDELPDMLAEKNVQVQEIQVYRTEKTGKAINIDYDGIFFFSPSAVESFFESNIVRNDIPCFCVGSTTQAAVKNYTGNRTIKAKEPSQEMVLMAAAEYFEKVK
jgi:uroporphyrinogen-III synthase